MVTVSNSYPWYGKDRSNLTKNQKAPDFKMNTCIDGFNSCWWKRAKGVGVLIWRLYTELLEFFIFTKQKLRLHNTRVTETETVTTNNRYLITWLGWILLGTCPDNRWNSQNIPSPCNTSLFNQLKDYSRFNGYNECIYSWINWTGQRMLHYNY